jgi:hypothetical protein
MIVSFLPDLKSFMAIFLVSLGCFALLGTLLFRETAEFAGLMDAFLVLTSDPLKKV